MDAIWGLAAQAGLTLLGIFVKNAALTADQKASYMAFVEAWAPHFKSAAKQFKDYQDALASLNKPNP